MVGKRKIDTWWGEKDPMVFPLPSLIVSRRV
jgi:hypothetical protein